MKIAVEGCAHGALDEIYSTISGLEQREGVKVDLLLCCGDFQATRNENDLRCMAIPPKFYDMCSFYKYYTGEKQAPILTIFIGGNHEASNYLQELPYGGWVAPNIYYLGYAGIVNYRGVRIGGISGIYKKHDYMRGRYEKPPYSDSSKRSVYHTRNIDIFRLKQLGSKLDIFMSHDWPTNITNYGNVSNLLKKKPFFQDDIDKGELGSPPLETLLEAIQPRYWFSGHLHCKFAALVEHKTDEDKVMSSTRFLALDKCLPRRQFLQILDIESSSDSGELQYDLGWLSILHHTNHLISVKSQNCYMPSNSTSERSDFTPTEAELDFIKSKIDNNVTIPQNFCKTSAGYDAQIKARDIKQPWPVRNPQTADLCTKLGIDDPLELVLLIEGAQFVEFKETEISENELEPMSQSFRPSLGAMSLPRPKQESVMENNDGDYENLTNSAINRSGISFLSLPKPRFGAPSDECEATDTSSPSGRTSLCMSVSKSLIDDECEQHGSPISSKKFKRRNQSLYNEDDDTG